MDRTKRRTWTGAVGMLAAAVALNGCGEPGAQGPAATTQPAARAPSARFQADLYAVQVPADRVSALDAKGLAALSGGAEEFARKLAALGESKLLYHVDQVVDLRAERIRVNARTPLVTNTRVTSGGQRLQTVQYEQTGVQFEIAGKPLLVGGEPKGTDVRISIELSVAANSGVEVTKDVPAVVIRQATLSHNGPVDLGKPVVIVSADAATGSQTSRPVAFVARLVLSDLRP